MRFTMGAMAVVLAAPAVPTLAAEPVMVQCGRAYQAAKSAGTLNGMDWNSYRVACADRLKASATAAAPVPSTVPPILAMPVAAPASVPAASPATSPPTPSSTSPSPAVADPAPAPAAGTAAMHARQKQCGAEWTANKATLVAATPGLTWPRYWSQCNARIKASGR